MYKITTVKIALLVSLSLIFGCSPSKMKHIMNSDPILRKIDKEKENNLVQIRYTQIIRDQKGVARFKSHDYQVDNNSYFYPASTAKMPVAILSLQKLRQLTKETNQAIDKNTPMYNYAYRAPQSDYVFDQLTGRVPTIADYIDQIFCVSDNNAHNRLFELLGSEYLNQELYKRGAFKSSRIIHRLGVGGFTPDDHEYVNAVVFKDLNKEINHVIPARHSVFKNDITIKNQQQGIGYIDNEEKLIHEPFDFSKKNYISITDLEGCMQRVLFPESFAPSERFDLAEEDYKFLRRSMSILPREISYFAQDTHYYDNYVKYYFDGGPHSTIPDHLKIYNKVGWAYGFLTDCSYIVDQKQNLEYMITATIRVNKDGIFNDGKYEYEEVGIPFFRALGKAILREELRKKASK